MERSRNKKLQSKSSGCLPSLTPWPLSKHCSKSSSSATALSVPSVATTAWYTHADKFYNERTSNEWALQSQSLQKRENTSTTTPFPQSLSSSLKLTKEPSKKEPLWKPTPLPNIIKKKYSRRIEQRFLKRCFKKKEAKLNEHLTLKLQHTKRFCLKNFGIHANPNKSLQENFNNSIKLNPAPTYLQPLNLTYHNLCAPHIKLPLGTKQLLGLNLKFCLAANKLPDNIKLTTQKLAYSIRTKYFLLDNNYQGSTEYVKQIYKKNTRWNPPAAPLTVEDKITDFEKSLKTAQQNLIRRYGNRSLSNLTSLQLATLRSLRLNTDIVKPTDKNLGPALLDISSYIHQVLQEHLLTADYKQLTQTEMSTKMSTLKTTLSNLITSHSTVLTEAENTYFKRSLSATFRLPIFYGLPKVHKVPMSLRPVVSSTNSLLSVFSTWLDYRMKELLHLVQSYLKDSSSFIQAIKELQLPDNALLFTADAKSMYTNIDATTGISSFKQFLICNRDRISANFPCNLFLEILEIVMNNNIFSFANTYWLQLTGTAMGTPAACSYATITFGHFENTVLLPTFKNNLLFYRHYIDDIFGVWLPPRTNKSVTWNNFTTLLNSWGNLEWVANTPSTTTPFLDLNVTLKNSTIVTSTYQKPLNLYLYLPPSSAHPASCLKGLIKGELYRYWLQNQPTDFQELVTQFLIRLCNRGHTIEHLTPIITQAAALIESNRDFSQTKQENADTLYIHWKHHPNGLQRQTLRQLFNDTLRPVNPFHNMTVAISRPKNLRDILTKAALHLPMDLSLQPIINDLKIQQR
jgi:hypothetical protein